MLWHTNGFFVFGSKKIEPRLRSPSVKVENALSHIPRWMNTSAARTIDASDDEGGIVLVRGHVRIGRDALDVRVTRHREDRDHLGIIDAITRVVLVTLLGVQEEARVSVGDRIAGRSSREVENVLEVEADVQLTRRVEVTDGETLIRVLVGSTERVDDASSNSLVVLVLFLEDDDGRDDLRRDALQLSGLDNILHHTDGRNARHVATGERIVEDQDDRLVSIHEYASLVIVARDLLDLEIDALILVRSLDNVGHERLAIGAKLARRSGKADVIHHALSLSRPRGGRFLGSSVVRRSASASCASSKRESCFSHCCFLYSCLLLWYHKSSELTRLLAPWIASLM